MKDIDFKKDLQVFPHGVVIPEIAAIFNKIRSFNGTKLSTRLFFKSKIDELTAIIIQKAEEFRLPDYYETYLKKEFGMKDID